MFEDDADEVMNELTRRLTSEKNDEEQAEGERWPDDHAKYFFKKNIRFATLSLPKELIHNEWAQTLTKRQHQVLLDKLHDHGLGFRGDLGQSIWRVPMTRVLPSGQE